MSALSCAYASVFNSDIGLQARDADAGSVRVQCVAEPTAFASVPSSHIYLLADANDPDRRPAPQGPVSTSARDLISGD